MGITQRYLCYTIKPQITLFSLQWLPAGSVQLREKNAQVHCDNARGSCGQISPQVHITTERQSGESYPHFSECSIIYIIAHF